VSRSNGPPTAASVNITLIGANFGTQFTCFTGPKVQILTQKVLLGQYAPQAVSAALGDTVCTAAQWLSDTALTCAPPPAAPGPCRCQHLFFCTSKASNLSTNVAAACCSAAAEEIFSRGAWQGTAPSLLALLVQMSQQKCRC
jgi:hypothetical protein